MDLNEITDEQLDELLQYPQFALIGGKQIGRTELLRRLRDRAIELGPPAGVEYREDR